MKLEYLSEFLALSRSCNFSEAADAMFISVSSLSRHIAALEEEIGQPLFVRDSRNVKLSNVGQLLVAYAERAEEERKRFVCELRECCGHDNVISIGFSRGVIPYGFFDRLMTYKQISPDPILLTSNSPLTLIQMLKNDEYDFIIDYDYHLLSNEFASTVLVRDTMAAAVPLSHALAGRNCIDIRELENEYFVEREETGPACNFNAEMCRAAGFESKIKIHVGASDYVMLIVSRGAGIALVEKERHSDRCPEGVKLIDLAPITEKRVVISYRKKKLSPSQQQLLKYLTKA